MADRSPTSLLNRVDFPTLGRPTSTTQGGFKDFLAINAAPQLQVKLAEVLTPLNYSTYDIYDHLGAP